MLDLPRSGLTWAADFWQRFGNTKSICFQSWPGPPVHPANRPDMAGAGGPGPTTNRPRVLTSKMPMPPSVMERSPYGASWSAQARPPSSPSSLSSPASDCHRPSLSSRTQKALGTLLGQKSPDAIGPSKPAPITPTLFGPNRLAGPHRINRDI